MNSNNTPRAVVPFFATKAAGRNLSVRAGVQAGMESRNKGGKESAEK